MNSDFKVRIASRTLPMLRLGLHGGIVHPFSIAVHCRRACGWVRSRLMKRNTNKRAGKGHPLRAFAMSLPGATEEFPWGERVIKVGGKVFVFMGQDPGLDEEMCFSVKLPESGKEVLRLPIAQPTGYGLDKHGWVTIRCPPDQRPP